MNDVDLKTCPHCAEQIKAAARVCPRCRQWLTFFSLRNPAFLNVACLLCVLVTSIVFYLFIERISNSGVDFSPYRDGILVKESRMNFATGGEQDSVRVVGVLTNETAVGWKNIQLDVRFFDKTGTLIDARTYPDGARIYAHSESSFQINLRPSRAFADYDSYKIYVRAARDMRCLLSY